VSSTPTTPGQRRLTCSRSQRQESSLRRKESLRQKQRTGMRPNDEFYLMGRVPKTRG